MGPFSESLAMKGQDGRDQAGDARDNPTEGPVSMAPYVSNQQPNHHEEQHEPGNQQEAVALVVCNKRVECLASHDRSRHGQEAHDAGVADRGDGAS